MEKLSSMEIDMDEWEFLPSDHGRKFICPYAPSMEESSPTESEFVTKKKIDDRPIDNEFKDVCFVPPEKDHDATSQVLFEKQRDNNFADMKIDSPKPETALIPVVEKIEIPEADKIFIEEKEKGDVDLEIVKEKTCRDVFGFNIWRWRIAGLGPICSVGLAAATLCMFILGNGKSQKQRQYQLSQKLQFQIYADEKGIKQAMQHASRLNQAMQGSRAHISFGGYYDGL